MRKKVNKSRTTRSFFSRKWPSCSLVLVRLKRHFWKIIVKISPLKVVTKGIWRSSDMFPSKNPLIIFEDLTKHILNRICHIFRVQTKYKNEDNIHGQKCSNSNWFVRFWMYEQPGLTFFQMLKLPYASQRHISWRILK